MTEEKKREKLEYLRKQKENPTGKYRTYLVRTYMYILEDCKIDNRGWSKQNLNDMVKFIYENKPDHMGWELALEYKKTLKDLGYIKNVKENNEWHTYIIKELDF